MKTLKMFVVTMPAFVCLLLSLSLTATAKPAEASKVANEITVVQWTVIPRSVDGAPARTDQNRLFDRLSDEAVSRTERLLLRRNLAAVVLRAETQQNVSSLLFVTGTIELPIALPQGTLGLKARSREGVFAVAKVNLVGSSARVLATEQASLNWNDANWTYGGRRKRNHTVDEMLIKFTRKAVDRAVEQLGRRDLRSFAR